MFDFLSKKFFSIFEGLGKQKTFTIENSEKICNDIKELLIDADVPYTVATDFVASVRTDLVGKSLKKGVPIDQQITYAIYQRLVAFLGGAVTKGSFSFQLPSTILLMGLQGAGKTTTIAKLAHYIQAQAIKKQKSRSILCASIDFYRPAAIDQLEILAKKVGIGFYRPESVDPVKAALAILDYAKKNNVEVLLLDTAGRMHIDDQMCNELVKVCAALNPRYKFLVLDGMTGQESLSVAQSFDSKVGFTGAILTKLDSGARAGCAFAFRYVLKKQIYFVGTGEKIDQFEEFHPDRIAQRMLSFGDVQTLAERLDEKINAEKQSQLYAAVSNGRLTLEDFASQIDIVNSLGSLEQVIKYIPGMGASLSSEQLQKGQKEMKSFRAIINSMTPQERLNVQLINDSRKKRIANGAGVAVQDIENLLARFQHAQEFAKIFKGSTGTKRWF